MLRSNGRRVMAGTSWGLCRSSSAAGRLTTSPRRCYTPGSATPADEAEQDKALREGVLRGFDQMHSLERMEVEGKATLPDSQSGVSLILQGSGVLLLSIHVDVLHPSIKFPSHTHACTGKILQVKVDQEVADNVENVEKLFVAASQNARQKVPVPIQCDLLLIHHHLLTHFTLYAASRGPCATDRRPHQQSAGRLSPVEERVTWQPHPTSVGCLPTSCRCYVLSWCVTLRYWYRTGARSYAVL
jgi:hypothetical protein